MRITVPYEVRKGGTLTLTVRDSRSGKTGGYTMSFIGFSEQPTFNDDFNTLNTDVWKQCCDNDGNLYKSGTVSDDKLIFTILTGVLIKQFVMSGKPAVVDAVAVDVIFPVSIS